MADLNSVGKVIRKIIDDCGERKLLDNQKTLGLFLDLAPQMHNEEKLLRVFLERDGARKLLEVKHASAREQEACMRSLADDLQKNCYLQEKAAQHICTEFFWAVSGRRWEFPKTSAPVVRPHRNLDIRRSVTIREKERATGKNVSVDTGSGTVNILVPANVTSGQTLCFKGKGQKAPDTGETGDLYVTVHVTVDSAGKTRLLGVVAAVLAVLLCISLFTGRGDKTGQENPGTSSGNSVQQPSAQQPSVQQQEPAHNHSWKPATYQDPQTCASCGAIQGYSLSHDWRREPVQTATGVIEVSPGGWTTYALTDSGNVYAIGRNQDGQMDVGRWSDIVAISGGDRHVVLLHSDGTVDAVGHSGHGQCDVYGWRNIIDVSAGVYCTVGICEDGTVRITGKSPETDFDVSDWEDIVRVDISDHYIVGLRCDGTVVTTGLDTCGQLNVSSWRDITDVAVGEYHTLGLRSDGTVVATGDNRYGACDVSDWEEIVAITAGATMSVGLRSDGTVVVAGCFSDVNKISKWLGTIDTPRSWRNIIQVEARYNQIIGLTEDGEIVACGFNTYGQCVAADLHRLIP